MGRVCVICGVGIEHRQSSFLTCSAECSVQLRLVRGRIKAAEYRAANPEKVKQSRRKSYHNRADFRREESRRYYEKNAKDIKERAHQWRKDNPEKVKANSKRYYEDNADALRERARLYAIEHANERREYRSRTSSDSSRKRREKYSKAQAALLLIQDIETKGLEALL